MTKTNHARGFKDIKFTLGQRSHHPLYNSVKAKALDGDMIIACGDIFSENSKGIRRSRAGAKKFVHSRRRRKDRDFFE